MTDMSFLSGSVRMAYFTGMQALQEKGNATRQMLVAAKQGKSSYTDFATALKQAETKDVVAAEATLEVASADKTEEYMNHLKEKYGIVRIESVPRDQASLDKVGGTMCSGHGVVISPIMLEKMADDPEKAQDIEGKIDYFFNNIPKYEMEAAAMGLTFESCGCVVHDDGTVTYICGGGDPPERVEEVNRINREKREKEAQRRRISYEKGQEEARHRRELEQETLERRRTASQMTKLNYYNTETMSFDADNVDFLTSAANNSALVASLSGMFR